jgi:hypothetical protein
MALHLDPGDHEPLHGEKVRGAASSDPRRIIADGVQRLARGALVCPSCALPLLIEAPIPAARELQCGFCDHAARAREFVARDVYDTAANNVCLIARVQVGNPA